ncbi:choice-of-anchor C family protein [Streptomyces sp. NPDC000594]|uniref:choice-of-anchor C family protein n=1 Tax=Streptomyces sp. NPDC000594 TaxID=3154261 RepID=UPI0033329D19
MKFARLLVTGAVAGLVMAVTGSASAAPSRFDDGSFEYPIAPANSFATIGTGGSIGPWKVTSGGIDLIGAGFWQAAEGNQSVDLNAGVAGSIAQTFTTTPGRTYTVTFALAANPAGGAPVKTGRVLVDGRNLRDLSFDSTGKTFANMGYVTRKVAFVADGATTTLAFASTIGGAYGPVIDDVRVEACGCGCGA